MNTVYVDSVVQGLGIVDKSAIVRGNPTIDLRQLTFLSFFEKRTTHNQAKKKRDENQEVSLLLF